MSFPGVYLIPTLIWVLGIAEQDSISTVWSLVLEVNGKEIWFQVWRKISQGIRVVVGKVSVKDHIANISGFAGQMVSVVAYSVLPL